MFSYLQDKRVRKKKSANLLASHSSRPEPARHDAPTVFSSASGTPLGQRANTTHPPAPPSTSRPAPKQVQQQGMVPVEKPTHWSFKGDRPHTSGSAGPYSRPLPASGGYSSPLGLPRPTTNGVMAEKETGEEDYERPRRLIDLRFEEMRAAPMLPFQQSTFQQSGLQANVMPQRVDSTSPPLSQPVAQNVLMDSGHEGPVAIEEAVPRLRNVGSMSSKPSVSRSSRRQFAPAQIEASSSERPAIQPRPSRSRLTLMNPMQLLTKRRSQAPAQQTFAEDQSIPAPQIPADYDPRIRGKVVHDFSAPRPPKQETETRSSRGRESIRAVEPDVVSQVHDPDHAAHFKEEFDDGLEKSQDPATRSKAFLQAAAAQASHSSPPDPAMLPTFAPKMPLKLATDFNAMSKSDAERSGNNASSLEVVVESPDQDQTKPLPFLPRAASSSTTVSDRTLPGLGSPQRHKSNSSRFSFDMAGVGSTVQEKLLEDKHREKTQTKKRESILSYQSTQDSEMYCDVDDFGDAGFEERIPGVNCDEDDDMDQQPPTLRRDAESFPYASPNKSSFESTDSPISTGVTSLDTPFLGAPWATSTASKSVPNLASLPIESVPSTETVQNVQPGPDLNDLPDTREEDTSQRARLEDDIYFDDGMIDELGDDNDLEGFDGFDESVFDDNSNGIYGVPIRDRTIKPSEQIEGTEHNPISDSTADASGGIHSRDKSSDASIHHSLSSEGISAELRDAITDLGQPNMVQFNQGAGLTHDNLAAYNQNVLVNAVNQAALSGAFNRSNSVQKEQPLQLAPLNTSSSERSVPADNTLPSYRGDYDNTEDDDFDGLDDDDIVAAANAEALENDDEGLYGSEFGFFARSAATDSELINGGYFGGKGIKDGIMRSHSGKATNFQEPSLTPITERSEWSNRNSTISLAQMHHMHGFPPMPSPGLDMRHEDLNAQLAMLKQLRKGAWGGSDASLPSSSGSQSQPQSQGAVSGPAPTQNNEQAALDSKSRTSSPSHPGTTPKKSDKDCVAATATTTTMHQRTKTASTPSLTAPLMPPPPVPPKSAPSTSSAHSSLNHAQGSNISTNQKAKGHSRNSSTGTESVSYKTEGGRWIMEKRRMSETGETTMVGRRVLDAGMI